ncbi:MAG TPA: hypothetical protein VMU58_05885, partial [Gaiellaceae bacterium]|nr:hypothetical protein [Gaiellaceae bacterium]
AALALDAVAAAVFVGFFAVVMTRGPDETDGATFFSDPLPAALALAAAAIALAAGAVAAVSLARLPLRTRAGRWAVRLALANALLIPAVVLPVTFVAWLVDAHLSEGWGQPMMPFWFLSGLASAALGVAAKESGRRGILVIPFMIGALVLTFWLGEFLVPH